VIKCNEVKRNRGELWTSGGDGRLGGVRGGTGGGKRTKTLVIVEDGTKSPPAAKERRRSLGRVTGRGPTSRENVGICVRPKVGGTQNVREFDPRRRAPMRARGKSH